MNNRNSDTPLDRINNSVTGARAFRITLGVTLAGFLVRLLDQIAGFLVGLLDRLADLFIGLLDTIATLLITLALLAGFVYVLWLLIESLSK